MNAKLQDVIDYTNLHIREKNNWYKPRFMAGMKTRLATLKTAGNNGEVTPEEIQAAMCANLEVHCLAVHEYFQRNGVSINTTRDITEGHFLHCNFFVNFPIT